MNIIEFGDCREIMRRWKDQGIKAQTCVTSPPYYGLRDYGTAKWHGGDANCDHIESENKHGGQRSDRNQEGYKKQYKDVCKKCGSVRVDNQLGLEETPEEYIQAMVEVFRCVWDVLENDGTLWVNIGDSYASKHESRTTDEKTGWKSGNLVGDRQKKHGRANGGNIPPKNLIGIPWMLAFALRADGWYLRQDIIWHKPNPMPESVQDRCTKAHEYIFLLSKSQKYYYDIDAIKDDAVSKSEGIKFGGNKYGDNNDPFYATKSGNVSKEYEKSNKRSVWTIPVKPYSGAHFAVFPQELIEPCIMAGAPVGGVVLDPFMGSGTTAQVAKHLNRQYLGCELNLDYKPLQDKRLRQFCLELV